MNAGALAGSDMAELDLPVICIDVDFGKRHHRHQGATDTHVVAHLHVALRDHSVYWRQNFGVGQIELCLVALRFGLPEACKSAVALSLERLDLPLRELQRLVPFLIQGTELVSHVLERVARRLAATTNIRLMKSPFDLPDIHEAMYWHPRHTTDPGHRWLRERLKAIAGEFVTL